jgi:cytochrome c-type biogenesis protein CcmH
MRDELAQSIQGGQTDQQILDNFEGKYGATVLAAPTTKGFNLVAWIAPFAVFLAAVLGTLLVVKQWSANRQQPAPAAALTPEAAAMRDKIRRETGGDGGF